MSSSKKSELKRQLSYSRFKSSIRNTNYDKMFNKWYLNCILNLITQNKRYSLILCEFNYFMDVKLLGANVAQV